MLKINHERLQQQIMALGQIGALPGGGVNRLALTDADKAGRDWALAYMQTLGLEIQIDQIGNVFATYAGTENLPPVMAGSHIDTVRTGGLYDGNLGVLAALEVIHTLKDAGIRPLRPITAAIFTNEEGSRFQPDMLGSLVYVGGMPLDEALNAVAIDGLRLGDELQRIDYAGQAPVGKPAVDSYFELHIEQGPVLDKQKLDIGVVEGVQGICWTQLKLHGKSNHAGTTPMHMRRDAGMAAMRIAEFVHQLVKRYGGRQLGTVGSLNLEPNLINVIAQTATMTVDLRNTDGTKLKAAHAELLVFAQNCATEHGVECETTILADFAPVSFDPEMVNSVEAHAKALGLSTLRMPSGAGHDAQMLARVCPTAMIFVPSVDGLSHNVREFTAAHDIANGAQVLLQVMLERANRP